MRPGSAADGALLPPGWRPDRSVATPRPHRPGPRVDGAGGTIVLGDGTKIVLRPLVAADRELLADAFDHLSPRSRYRRFLSPMPRLSETVLSFLTDVDQVDHFAWAAVVREPGGPGVPPENIRGPGVSPENISGPVGVGTSRFVRLGDPAAADAAVTVIDDYQGRGIGGLLLDALVLRALDHGITRFQGVVLEENLPSRAMLTRAGARFEPDGGGVLRYCLDLPARARDLSRSPLHTVLRRYPPPAAVGAPLPDTQP
jgi:protein lysine acetyltransferase